ncbi:MAG: hypothetical protein ABI480_13045 [Chitinophagaceae bacterium]
MKDYVKTLGFFTFLILVLNVSSAQLSSLSLRKNDILSGIEQVIRDYPNQFKNIIGELITENPQSADYRCTVKIDNTEESFITKYTATDKEIYSWQALVLTTENFEEAKRKFKSLFNELNNRLIDAAYLKGTYEAPAEEKKFTNVLFSFPTSDENFKKLKVELVMEAALMEWKVRLLIYDRERADNEHGPAVE